MPSSKDDDTALDRLIARIDERIQKLQRAKELLLKLKQKKDTNDSDFGG